jgi:DNA repair photolyase
MLFPFDNPPGPQLVGIAKLAAEGRILESKRQVEYHELPTRNWINRCVSLRGVPFVWTINPYRGCEFGCKYCYARYTHEFLERRGIDDFETEIYAKQWNASSFATELRKLDRQESIAIGTATDPYQPAERRFELTRKMLQVFAKDRGRRVYLISKSDLIARDIDLFQQIAASNALHITITITTTDIALARTLEPMAPRPDLRLRALQKLSRAGITVGVNANPVIPMITDSEANLDAVAKAASRAGAKSFHGGLLFLKPCSRRVFFPFLQERFPHLLERYAARYGKNAYLKGDYVTMMEARVATIRKRYGLDRRLLETPPPQPDEQLSLY